LNFFFPLHSFGALSQGGAPTPPLCVLKGIWWSCWLVTASMSSPRMQPMYGMYYGCLGCSGRCISWWTR
jgi:hypothetical protein